MGPPRKMTPDVKAAFLNALAKLGEPKAACAAARISWPTMARERKRDPEFAEGYKEAMAALDEELMGVARMLAIEGVLEETLDPRSGKVIRRRRRYDARLLEKWLKRRMPQEWGDKVRVEASGTINHVAQLAPADLTALQRRAMRQLLGEPAQEVTIVDVKVIEDG